VQFPLVFLTLKIEVIMYKILLNFSSIYGAFTKGQVVELCPEAAEEYCRIGYAEKVVKAKAKIKKPKK